MLVLLALASALTAPGAASAGIWSQVDSGTPEDILAIEYQADDRMWFTTAGGKIFRREGGGFRQVFDAPVTLLDIAFQPGGGGAGLAVGQGGKVYRSGDSGATWSEVRDIPVSNEFCTDSAPLADVTAVRFASQSRVFLFGGISQIARSEAAGEPGSWADANRAPENACRIASDRPITDAFFPEPGVGFFMSQDFGETFFSTDDLQSPPPRQGEGPNGFENVHRLAGDPLNQNRQWALTPEDGNGSYFQRTESGWRSSDGWTIANDGERAAGYDVAYAGGTVLAAGNDGMILNSTDGANFYFNRADGALGSTDWRSVGLAGATLGAVGGAGGVLVMTRSANSIPGASPARDFSDPSGTIAGPESVPAGVPVTFTATAADNPGGSGIDPAGFTWDAVAEQSVIAGPAATYTFTEPGRYDLKVTFRDRGANEGVATRVVTVTRAQGSLPPTAKPPIKIGRSRGKVRITVKGRLRIPAGLPAAKGCRGNVIATVKKGKRLISARVIKISSRCAFRKTITLRRSKVGRARKLGITLRLEGNEVVGTTRRSYKLRVPRR